MNETVFHLFEAYGIELEYMIVDRDTLSVLPVTDRFIQSVAGAYESEIERGDLCWSNELVLHVVELKTNGPAKSLNGLGNLFHTHIREINHRLESFNGRLMPTAMHPWMNPECETHLWPHNNNIIYETYNRIFDCRGHGWSNLQSVHINLPFSDDREFGLLHAAIRLILPILPALGASSPIVECRPTEFRDNRMEFYRTNSLRIPSLAGHVIPEPVYTRSDYESHVFQTMYDDISPFDPEGILQHEWLNARGAIARFDRNAIEIRVLDIQECPQADLAIAYATASALQSLIAEQWTGIDEQQCFPTDALVSIFRQTIRDAELALIQDTHYLKLFGIQEKFCTAGDLWNHILEHRNRADVPEIDPSLIRPLQTILEKGSLASRILQHVGNDYSKETLTDVYGELCDCLEYGRMFNP